jgi:Ca2+-binding RTX toxin-like protein
MARYTGTAGNDTRTGGNQNNQFVNYGEGADTLTGGNRSDNFVLTVDEFKDRVDGGNGIDTVNYSNADRGVSVNLDNGTTTAQFFYEVPAEEGGHGAASGWAEPIVTELRNIENVVGSEFDDTIVGNSGDNVIEGGGGADRIYGGDGRDTVSYEHSEEGVTISLNTRVDLGFTTLYIPGQGHGGDAEGDRLWQIENVIGSGYNDVITGNREDNVFTGGDGNDTFIFKNGVGHDTITDFDATGGNHDYLQFEQYFDSFEDLMEHAQARGNDVVITIDEHNSITLEDVRLNQLDENDFYFI